MSDEIPAAKKAAEEAEKRKNEKPDAVKKSAEKVKRHVEEGKTSPSADLVDSAPDTTPAD